MAQDVPEPVIVADGDHYTLVLPQEYADLAKVIASLTSAIPTCPGDVNTTQAGAA